ncbi:MAG TPA: hypothetical protein VJ579_01270 [Candidatus Paceibacterota bacterium]|nr:hypothetical protein [Candidatus Paceibacterota bacterium]
MMRQAIKRMRFLLNAREKIAGVSFTDGAIFCVLEGNRGADEPARILTHKLPPRVIIDGIVIDHNLLARELEQVLRELNTQVSFVNLSLPSALIFSTILHLPKSVNSANDYNKALELMLDVELPWKREAAYTDFNITESDADLRANIFSILRSAADPYILAAEHAGVEVLALEFDAASTARLMEQQAKNTLSVSATTTHVSIFVTKDKTVRFLFTLPLERVPDEQAMLRELTRVRNYFATETGEEINDSPSDVPLNASARSLLGKFETDISVYPAAGAAIRNPITTQTTRELSLLPLRSDELYNLHRIASGLQLLRQATIATCLILLGADILLMQILGVVSKQSIARATNAPHIYSNIAEIDKETAALDNALLAADNIGTHMKRYSSALDLIDHIATDGITITSITTGSGSGPITISGTAATRNQYNFFRTSIVATEQLEVLSFPLGGLDTSLNIPFTLTVKI